MPASQPGEPDISTRPEAPTGSAAAPAVALALTSLAAAGIHFAVISDHSNEGLLFGLFFALVAWAQALWAVAVLVVATRLVLVAGILGNLAVIALWAVSRTVGVPVGQKPWTPKPVGYLDLLVVVLEAALVVGCIMMLERRSAPATPALLVFGVVLAVGTSVAIAAGPEHEHAGTEAAHSHETGGQPAAVGHDGHALVGGDGEPDPAQVAVIRQAMRKYRDIEAARAAGWDQEHPDYPEIGAHFARSEDWNGSFPAQPGLQIRQPEFLMYSKLLTGHWKLVAVAYVFDQARYPDPPEGIIGAQYHEHVWTCIRDGEELEEEDWGVISQDECQVMGGRWSPGGVWMTHVWLVPNPEGIFAETNPRLV